MMDSGSTSIVSVVLNEEHVLINLFYQSANRWAKIGQQWISGCLTFILAKIVCRKQIVGKLFAR